MANVNRGEIVISVGGKDYVLRFSANALCDLESELKKPVMQIMESLRDPANVSMTLVRALLWAGLKEKHPSITVKEAGDIIEQMSMAAAYARIGQAFQAAFPTPQEGDENPLKADGQALGTGLPSTAAGSN